MENTAPTLKDLTYTVEEASERLSLPIRTVYVYVQQGLIPAIRLGRRIRIRRDTVDAILGSGLYRRVV
jgi:excisionase family DNA binding protein